MGTVRFQQTGRGSNAQEVYSNLIEDAKQEYGHQQGYSGAINSTHGFRDMSKDFKNSGKKLEDYINLRFRDMDSRSCECICIEEPKSNPNKVKSQVEHVVEAGTKKWLLKYRVTAGWKGDHIVGVKDSKGDAIKIARDYTEKHKVETQIEMIKVLEKGSTVVAKIKYKQSNKEKPGKWVFFGNAKD